MATTLEDLIGYEVLTGVIQSPDDGIPNIWPASFMSTTQNVDGKDAKWLKVASTRRNARAVNYGSASRKAGQSSGTPMAAECVHFFEHITFEPAILEAIGRLEDPRQLDKARSWINFQLSDFKLKFINSRISSLSSMFRYGYIYMDGDGNVLPSSSGATQSIDLGIPSTNKDQLNGIISADWSNASTPILKNLQNLQKQARKNGKPIKYIYYGVDILSYLLANTEIKQLMVSDVGLTSSLRQGKIPDGFGIAGVVWVPLQDAFFDDSTGTNQDWFPADFIVAFPEADTSWFAMQVGSYPVPTSLDVQTDALSAISSLDHINGMFSYATVSFDPVGVKMHVGDTFLPAPKNPNSIFIGNTVV